MTENTTLLERIERASQEIYERTDRTRENWVQHWHGPEDRAETCVTCKFLGITQEDWDRHN